MSSIGPIDERWWDGRVSGTFFPKVYYEGDNSIEGFLNNVQLVPSARTARECDFLEQLFRRNLPDRSPKDIRILDCPCGMGRHSIELARRGYRVVGVDLAPVAIEAARAALAKEPTEVRARCDFRQGDMRRLDLDVRFTAVINMFLSFGFFSPSENEETIRSFYRMLEPKGLLAIHTDVNPYLIESKEYGDRPERTLPGGGKLLVEERWNNLYGRLEGKWTIQRPDGSSESATYSVQILTLHELQAKLSACGFVFRKEIAMPTFSGAATVEKAQDIVYVATRL